MVRHSRPSERRELLVDIGVLAVCVGGAVLVAAVLLFDLHGGSPQKQSGVPRVATLAQASAGVRRRPPRTLVWERIGPGEPIYEGDALFVPPAGDAVVVLQDSSRFVVGESSMVVIDSGKSQNHAWAGLSLQLAQGQLSGSVEAVPIELRLDGARVELGAGAAALLQISGEAEAQLDVLAGTAQLQRDGAELEVGARQRAQVGRGKATRVTAGYAALPEAPSSGARFYYVHLPQPIALRWTVAAEQELRLVIARGSSFDSPVLARVARHGSYLFTPPGEGDYFWGLVDAHGAQASPVRKLVVSQDRPPTLISPLAAGVVRRGEDSGVLFTWEKVAGVDAYLFELARSADFAERLRFVVTVQPQVVLEQSLAEGTYFWRVRNLDSERPSSPYSPAASFRLIDRPLPTTPELLDAVVEME